MLNFDFIIVNSVCQRRNFLQPQNIKLIYEVVCNELYQMTYNSTSRHETILSSPVPSDVKNASTTCAVNSTPICIS